MDHISTKPGTPDIDNAAVREHATAIAGIARRYFAAALAADPRAGADLPFRFEGEVRLAVGRQIRLAWQDVERAARRVADEAVRRAFAGR